MSKTMQPPSQVPTTSETAPSDKTDTQQMTQAVRRAGPSDETLRTAPLRADERRLARPSSPQVPVGYSAADPDSPTLEMDPLPPRSASASAKPVRPQEEADPLADPFAPTAELDLSSLLSGLPADIADLYDFSEPAGSAAQESGAHARRPSLNDDGQSPARAVASMGAMRAKPRRARRCNRRHLLGRRPYRG